MTKPLHRLLDKDPETATGTCEICGPVAIVPRTNGQGGVSLRCAVAIKLQRQTPRRHATPGPRYKPHGLTIKQAAAHRAGKSCEICGGPAQAVDHDHANGRRRGVLCRRHNTGLGFFADDPEELAAGIAYILRYRELHAAVPPEPRQRGRRRVNQP